MNISEKLIRAKTDLDEVFDAGKKAEYDRFWDSYQQNGKKKTYQGAFAGHGWNNENLKPKYNLNNGITNAAFMFYSSAFVGDLAQHLEDLGITLDTSKATNMASFANSAQKVTRFGVIDATGANTANSGNIFSFCMALEKIDKWVVSEATNIGTLTSCSKLTSLAIEGTIGQTGSFKDSPLDKESITSVVTHLSDTATKKSMTFKKTAVDTAFETSDGANDGSTSDEWQALIGTKPNWTVVLV